MGVCERLFGPEREPDERLRCVVCWERERNTVAFPCRHLACCAACARKLRDCPVCRARIRRRVPVVLS